jgi:hypothetical protein
MSISLLDMATTACLYNSDRIELSTGDWWESWGEVLKSLPYIPRSGSYDEDGIRKFFTLFGVRFECGLDRYDDHVKCLAAAGMI